MSRFLLLNFEDFGLNQDITKTIQSHTLFCICCLERNVSFINLLTCSHSDYLDNFSKPELKPINEVICHPCHDMLKKIKQFKLQVEESFSLLTSQALESESTDRKLRNFELCNIVNIYLPPETPNLNDTETINVEPTDKVTPTNTSPPRDENKMKNIKDALQIINNNSKNASVKLFTESVKSLVEKEAAPIVDIVTSLIKTEVTEPVIVKIEGNTSTEGDAAVDPSSSPNRLNIKNITLSEDELKEERDSIAASQPYRGLPYKCDKCLIGFNYKENLEDHNNRKHIAKKGSVICDICEQILYPAGGYTAHRYRHYSRFECGICYKRFCWYESAVDHYNMTHTEPRGSKEDRQRDRSPHTSKSSDTQNSDEVKKQRLYKCSVCRKVLKNHENLQKHMQNQHYDFPNLECDLCGRQYRTRFYLKRHMAKHFSSDKRKRTSSENQ